MTPRSSCLTQRLFPFSTFRRIKIKVMISALLLLMGSTYEIRQVLVATC